MDYSESERFQAFFKDENYVALKNDIYSYLLRKKGVNKCLKFNTSNNNKILEVGSGLSPLAHHPHRVVYSDISFLALRILKKKFEGAMCVVADAANLPFKNEIFSHIICSEVLEHIENDGKVIREVARVMNYLGRFIITFPHRRAYFAGDDRFVGHIRRYELAEMIFSLKDAGFRPIVVQKILGPIDKATICMIVYIFSIVQKIRKNKIKKKSYLTRKKIVTTFFKFFNQFYSAIAWMDALVMPRTLSTVLLIEAIRLKNDKNNFYQTDL